MCVCMCVSVCGHVCVCVSVCAYVCVCMDAHVNVCVYTYIYIYIYVYTHICIYTVYTCVRSRRQQQQKKHPKACQMTATTQQNQLDGTDLKWPISIGPFPEIRRHTGEDSSRMEASPGPVRSAPLGLNARGRARLAYSSKTPARERSGGEEAA